MALLLLLIVSKEACRVRNQRLYFLPKKVTWSTCTIERCQRVQEDTNKRHFWEVGFTPYQSCYLKRTSPFDDGAHCDFVFGKVGVENAERQKKYLPPVLNSYGRFLQRLISRLLQRVCKTKKLRGNHQSDHQFHTLLWRMILESRLRKLLWL